MIRNLTPPKNDAGYVSGRLPCVKSISKRGMVHKGDVPWIRKNQSVQTSFALTTGMLRRLPNLPLAPMFLSSVLFVRLAARPSGHTAFMPISGSATDSLLLPTFLSASSYLNLRRMACNAYGRPDLNSPSLTTRRRRRRMCLLLSLKPTGLGSPSTRSKIF